MEKLTQEQYASIIQDKKQQAHDLQWLFIEVNAKDFMNECEPGVKNQTVCCKAMLDALLEGDRILVCPKTKNRCGSALTVRYYTDNLSPTRAKYTSEPEF